MLKAEGVPDVPLDGDSLGQKRHDMPLFFEENDEVFDEQRSFINDGGGTDQRGNAAGNAGERTGVERIVADLHRTVAHAVGNIEEQGAVHDGGHDVQPDVPAALA